MKKNKKHIPFVMAIYWWPWSLLLGVVCILLRLSWWKPIFHLWVVRGYHLEISPGLWTCVCFPSEVWVTIWCRYMLALCVMTSLYEFTCAAVPLCLKGLLLAVFSPTWFLCSFCILFCMYPYVKGIDGDAQFRVESFKTTYCMHII